MSGIHTGNCGAVGKPLWPEDTVEYKLYAKGALSEDLTKLAVECIHFGKAAFEGTPMALWGVCITSHKG